MKFIVIQTIDIKQTAEVYSSAVKIMIKEFKNMLGFIIGLFTGRFIGVTVMCLMSIASHTENK